MNYFEQNLYLIRGKNRSESSYNNQALVRTQGRRLCPNSDLWWKEASLWYVTNLHELLTVSVTVRRASFNLSAYKKGARFTCPPSDTNLPCLQRINSYLSPCWLRQGVVNFRRHCLCCSPRPFFPPSPSVTWPACVLLP